MEKRITLETTLLEIARLKANIAIAEYASAHIQARFTNGDTENLEAALERCREIVDRLVKQEEMDNGMDIQAKN